MSKTAPSARSIWPNLPSLTGGGPAGRAEGAGHQCLTAGDRLQQHLAATDERLLESATRNPFYKPVKLAATVRADADVLLRLKGHQTRMNAISPDAMLRAIHQKT